MTEPNLTEANIKDSRCPDPMDLAKYFQSILVDYKGSDICLLDLRPYNAFTDLMFICTATSNRHAVNLSRQIQRAAKKIHCPIFSVEGEKVSEWIAIDLGVIVVHIMLQETRDFYSIEKIWL